MRPPQHGPREKKICIAASAHTCTGRTGSDDDGLRHGLRHAHEGLGKRMDIGRSYTCRGRTVS